MVYGRIYNIDDIVAETITVAVRVMGEESTVVEEEGITADTSVTVLYVGAKGIHPTLSTPYTDIDISAVRRPLET